MMKTKQIMQVKR